MAKKSTYIPDSPDQYKGKQIIFTSDRVLLNAKNDSVMLFAKQAIVFSSADSLHFNTDGTCIVNAPKIQLGLNATEPLLLGNKTAQLLKELLEKLDLMSEALGKATYYVGDVETPHTSINTPAQDLNKKVKELSSRLEEIKSKQNYTL